MQTICFNAYKSTLKGDVFHTVSSSSICDDVNVCDCLQLYKTWIEIIASGNIVYISVKCMLRLLVKVRTRYLLSS